MSLITLGLGPSSSTIQAQRAAPAFVPVYGVDGDEDDMTWGTDIRTFPAFDGTFKVRGGVRLVGEAIARRWLTRRGQLEFHPEYGEDIRQLLNDSVTDESVFHAKQALEREAEQDERVDDVEVELEHDFRTDTLTVSAEVTVATGPFRLTLTVTQVTATLVIEE